jgi:hypothetical protein
LTIAESPAICVTDVPLDGDREIFLHKVGLLILYDLKVQMVTEGGTIC